MLAKHFVKESKLIGRRYKLQSHHHCGYTVVMIRYENTKLVLEIGEKSRSWNFFAFLTESPATKKYCLDVIVKFVFLNS